MKKLTTDLRIDRISRIGNAVLKKLIIKLPMHSPFSIFHSSFYNYGLLKKLYAVPFCFLIVACSTARKTTASANANFFKSSYGYDATFLKQHTKNVFELSSVDGQSKVLVSADYQGRVMTSTATGDSGRSFGWLNYNLIAAAQKRAQFNPVGGEERFWLGPEGGQYALYFKGGDSFNIAHWQVPPLIDTMPYELAGLGKEEAVFRKSAALTNYSGTTFNLAIERTIRMLDKSGIESRLNATIPDQVLFVGYQTINRLKNTGPADWKKESGLLSIWLLGMFTPTPQTVVVIPFRPVSDARTYITDNYFGPVPPQRLQVQDSVLFFTCDGKYRSKIGLSPVIAKPVAASFDSENNVLTLVLPEIHENVPYVNSKWEKQQEPYKGDVINAYNDGPLADGSQLGPFYEIESSSPALELKQGETATYMQTTLHLQGSYASLRQLAMDVLHVDLDNVKR